LVGTWLVVTWIDAALADQHFRRFGQVVGDGYHSLLTAFAAQEHLRSCLIEVKIAQVDPERLRDTLVGSLEKKQQAPITSSAWRLLTRRVDEGVGSLRVTLLANGYFRRFLLAWRKHGHRDHRSSTMPTISVASSWSVRVS
jgi:hypothetical protein